VLFNTSRFYCFPAGTLRAGSGSAVGGHRAAKVWLVVFLVLLRVVDPWYLLLLGFERLQLSLGGLAPAEGGGAAGGHAGLRADGKSLGYLQVRDFFVENINAHFGAGWTLSRVILPLAISSSRFRRLRFWWMRRGGWRGSTVL